MKKTVVCLVVLALCVCMIGCQEFLGRRQKTVMQNSEEITFSWWGNDVRTTYTKEGIRLFEKNNPEIQVLDQYGLFNGYYTKLKVMNMSGSACDVMQLNYSWIPEFSSDGKGFYDLNKLTDYLDLSGYTDIDLSYGTSNGVLNALPIALNTATICFNETLLKEYGLQQPQTFDDYFKIANVVKKDGKYAIGMISKQTIFFLGSYYEQTTGENFAANLKKPQKRAQVLEMILDFYNKMMQEKVMMPIQEFNELTYSEEKVMGTMCWITDVDTYCKNNGKKSFQTVITPYPKKDETSKISWYIKPATLYGISNTTEHPEAAAKLLNFLVNDESMVKLQGIEKGYPVNSNAQKILKDSQMDLDSLTLEANTMMEKNQQDMTVVDPLLENVTFVDGIIEKFSKYVYNHQTKETTIEELSKLLDDILNEKK